MLQIKKRSGALEPFDEEKIKLSLANASDAIGQPLPASDINSIARELRDLLEGKDTVTSKQLYVMIIGILYARGLQDLTREYTGYKHNAWKI